MNKVVLEEKFAAVMITSMDPNVSTRSVLEVIPVRTEDIVSRYNMDGDVIVLQDFLEAFVK